MCPITASTYNIKEGKQTGKQTFIRKGYYLRVGIKGENHATRKQSICTQYEG